MRTSLIYAGRLERFLAFLIDTLLIILPIRLCAGLFVSVDAATGDPMVADIFYPIIFLIKLGYYTGFTASRWQATPGKRIVGIYVIRTDNAMLTPRDALERFLAFTLPFLPVYLSFLPSPIGQVITLMMLGYWFTPILYTNQRVGLHDRFCHTRVLIGKVGI